MILHLREGEEEFLSAWKLKSIIGKYSDHISLPILMQKEEWDAEKKEQVAQGRVGDGQQGGGAVDAQPRATSPTREYQEFYKQISYDSEAPLAYTHNRVEGRTEYTQLLYIPAKAPFDLWNRDKRGGVKLYVKRVFIMDDAEALMPVYLRFVKGVIDSADLPLNVSRELLQESRDVKAIREGSTKRVLAHAGVAGRQRGRRRARQVRRVLEGLRRGAEGRHRRGPRQPGAAGQAAALRLARRPTRACPSPTTSSA